MRCAVAKTSKAKPLPESGHAFIFKKILKQRGVLPTPTPEKKKKKRRKKIEKAPTPQINKPIKPKPRQTKNSRGY
jgi:hypothetical protein